MTICLGEGPELGQVIVADSTGRRLVLGTYEDALAMARLWQVLTEA
jgi:hypothetical protein